MFFLFLFYLLYNYGKNRSKSFLGRRIEARKESPPYADSRAGVLQINAHSDARAESHVRMYSVLEFGGMGRVGSVPRTNSCVRLERRNGTN
jgi:hypothetical protein